MSRVFLLLFLLFATHVVAEPLAINKNSSFIDLLPHSKIFIDTSRSLTLADVQTKDIAFQENSKNLLSYGFSPPFDVWIQFTLFNDSSAPLDKIMEYHNPITTHLQFFDPAKRNEVQNEGLFSIDASRRTINPIFFVKLEPYETKTYYLKASSYITTLIIKLNLWDIDHFYKSEIKHQLILALFFGAMLVLAFYNLFIYFFTRDISYFFYFLYISGVIVHHAIYIGLGTIYVLNQQWIIYSIQYASLIASFPIFALGLFTKSFLNTRQYPKLNTLLNIFLIILPLSVVVFVSTDYFNKYRNILAVLFLAYLLFMTIYATIKKNRQAYFILLGWSAIFIAILFMLLSSTGVFSIYQYFPYFIETALVFEAIVFSIALANRIKQLQIDKESVHRQLLHQQENEKYRLTLQVAEKTYDLKVALDEKELLLKELNHRVKNNMQMIISLIRLQSDDLEDERLQDVLTTIQNRINSMRHLHELLYKQNQVTYINTREYFNLLLEDIKESYSNEYICITMNIEAELKIDQAIYCGIILNELVTNSFKYAFEKNHQGTIHIHLSRHEATYRLSISDNGKGFEKQHIGHSLGLILVNTLAKKQLKGTIHTKVHHGVKTTIEWTGHE